MLSVASPADAPAVLALRDAAARWMVARGIAQWRPGDRPLSYFASAAATGDLLAWRSAGRVVGAVVVSASDRTWVSTPPATCYLHALVIDRAHAGLGRRVLAAAENHLRSLGVARVRLDCVAHNAALRAYYREAGYAPAGTRDLPAPWGSVALFEKVLADPLGLGRLSLGTGPLGNLYAPVPPSDAAGVVDEALSAGIRYFDTAPHYGAGVAEERLGAALAGVPRSSYVLSTKVGRLLVPREPGVPPDEEGFVDEPPVRRVWDFSADGVRRSLEASLTRLGVDRVDVLYLHDAAGHEDEVYRTGFPALAALRDEGVVTAIGAGLNEADVLTQLVTRLDLDVVLVANQYTLLEQAALSSLLPLCASRGIPVVAAAPFNAGILMGASTFPVTAATRARAASLRAACDAHGVPLAAAALQFPAAHPAVTTVLFGSRSPAELTTNLAAAATPIPPTFWSALRTAGLLDPSAPIPT